MGEKLVVGPFDRGLRTDRTPFVIDNDSFPTLVNAYQWRGRVKRKRGTSFLGRLQRFIGTTDASGNATITIRPIPIASGIVSFTIGTDVFTDPGGASPVVLLTNGAASVHTLDRATGVLTIVGSIALTSVIFFPTLPVMGLEEFTVQSSSFSGELGFDTDYAYNILTTFPYSIYDISFYKNLVSATYTGYLQKTIWTPTYWNGQNYQQFWTTNYQGALWTTNGISVPFNVANIGMQYKAITVVDNITSGPPAFADLTFATDHGLVVGDFLFINEVVTTTGINFQTGYVTIVVSTTKVTVEFPNATITTAGTLGIAQYLTSRADVAKDSLRWYDGDPTTSNPPTQTFQTGKGWVNFAPPLSQLDYSIADLPADQYYLVGAREIMPFKDRIVFFGPVVQTSTANSQVYLQDTIIYSQNGTPYYTCSYTNTPSSIVDTPISATNVFHPLLVPATLVPTATVPSNQTATPSAYFEDRTGFGGFITAGVDQPINTVNTSEDVLILGFDTLQARMTYTGNDIVPFNLFIINSELGSTSTFSAINLDKGVLSRGSRGFILTSQVGAQRFDLSIPDQVFQISLQNNGTERVCAQRDFINEWIYFTYPSNTRTQYIYPTQTLQYNYRDDSWAIFNESYTTYGLFRESTGKTWGNIGTQFATWGVWNEPWNAGASTLLQYQVIAGNQQGFIVFRDSGTNESNSLTINQISGSTVTSNSHSLNVGDYIVISGVLGTLSTQLNGKIFSVTQATLNTFILNPTLTTGTYLGGGLIQRMYIPQVQSKQFPPSWSFSRKTRIGAQQYLFTKTANGQVTLLIFLSQDDDTAYNTISSTNPQLTPPFGSVNNDSVVYSTVLFTCPESTNLGLTAANTNLNTPTAGSQQQIWHRQNTSLIGDTVQIGFTLSDAQMRDTTFSNQFAEIEFHGMILDINQSQLLC